LVLNPLKQWFN